MLQQHPDFDRGLGLHILLCHVRDKVAVQQLERQGAASRIAQNGGHVHALQRVVEAEMLEQQQQQRSNAFDNDFLLIR